LITDTKTIITLLQSKIGELTPRQVSDFTVVLSISYGNLGQELAEADMAYAKVWLDIKEGCDTVAEAEMRAKATPEYLKKKKLEYATKGLLQTIQALKKRQNVLADEARGQY